MKNNFMPDMAVENIHEIDIKILAEHGIKGIILDIDNTLESHNTPKPTQKTLEFIEKLKAYGFKICLISNGKQERVKIFNEELGFFAMAKAGKPLKKGYMSGAGEMGVEPFETAMVGDQIFTDIYGANRCGMYTVLVEPIEKIENSFFYIKRFLEKGIRRKIDKK